MQMAAYRTLLFRLHRSHSHVRESTTVHASSLPLLLWPFLLSSPSFTFPLFPLSRSSLFLSLSPVLSESTNAFTYVRVCMYDRDCMYIQLQTRRGDGELRYGDASIVRKRESTQFHERPRYNFAVNQVFSAIICGLTAYS